MFEKSPFLTNSTLEQVAEEDAAEGEVEIDVYDVKDRLYTEDATEDAAMGEVEIKVYEVKDKLLSGVVVRKLGTDVYEVKDKLLSEDSTVDKTMGV